MRTKLCPLFAVLALIISIHPALTQPTLGIVSSANQAILFWPAKPANYVLQSSANPVSTNWVFAIDAVPTTYGSQTAMMVNITAQTRFFRLIAIPTTTVDGMALIPAGWFTMGDTLDGENDAMPTNAYVSAFYVDTNLVSYSQWQDVYVWATNHGYSFDNAGSGKAANHPVQTVNWYDAVKWSNARSQQAGLTPVYYTDAGLTQVYSSGDVSTVYANWTAGGYQLPTEAEWEKAARGGLIGQRFPWGNTISERQANYWGDTSGYSYDAGPNGFNAAFDTGGYPYTSPVGSFLPNGYGLFDMSGNVEEWCWDRYGQQYGQPTNINPTGPSTGDWRVLRGGNWYYVAYIARCAFRDLDIPSFHGGEEFSESWQVGFGFRCVRGL